jgi:hypothetical protein
MPKQPSQSHKKSLEYFYEVSAKQDFNDAVWEMRAKYMPDRVAKEGGSDSGEQEKLSFYPLPLQGEAFLYEKTEQIEKEIQQKFLNKYALNNSFAYAIWYYIFHDLDFTTYLEDENFDLCKVEDLKQKPKTGYSKTHKDNELAAYPLAIKISPYASERVIRDFISREFKQSIHPLQLKYRNAKIKLGKMRARNPAVTSRNRLIWSLRDKPRKEIMKIVHQKTGELLDEGAINKIISNMRQET